MPGDRPKSVTIKDVAKRAHVAPATASKALRGVGNVGPSLIAAVKQAAMDLGYRPDLSARGPCAQDVSGSWQSQFPRCQKAPS